MYIHTRTRSLVSGPTPGLLTGCGAARGPINGVQYFVSRYSPPDPAGLTCPLWAYRQHYFQLRSPPGGGVILYDSWEVRTKGARAFHPRLRLYILYHIYTPPPLFLPQGSSRNNSPEVLVEIHRRTLGKPGTQDIS